AGGANDAGADGDTSRLSGFATRTAVGDPTVEQSAAPDAAFRDALGVLAERTLAADPLESGALFLLGQIAEWEGDGDKARHLMDAAARRSFRETAAVYQLLLRSLERKDYAEALDRADAILR